MNARFWVYVNDGMVKITLRPRQGLSWYHWWRHDEGWSSETESWYHDGAGVLHVTDTDGRDCDGRMSTEYRSRCRLSMLGARRIPECSEPLPEWERVSSSQRDYQAEAAGY